MPSRWIRWEPTTHIYEYSTDFAASWNPLPLNAAILTEGVIDPARFPPTIPKLDLGNIWTGVNTLSGVAPSLRWNETDAPADSKNWEIIADAQVFKIRTANDVLNTFADVLAINRSNNSLVVSHPAAATNSFSSAAAGSVGVSIRSTNPGTGSYAQLILANDVSAFACAMQMFSSGYTGSPEPDFASSLSIKAATVGGMSIVAQHASGGIRFYTGASAAKRLEITAAGNAVFSGTVTERNRAVGMGDWASYTPIWSSSGTQPVLGNGQLSGRYTRVGKTVYFEFLFIYGSTSNAGTGAYWWNLPLTAAGYATFVGKYLRSGATYQVCMGVFRDANSFQMLAHGVASQFGATVPFAWAVNDQFQVSGFYSEP